MNTARATSWSVKPGQIYCELVNLIDLMGKEWDNYPGAEDRPPEVYQ